MAENSFLDPDAISKGEALGLMARRVVEGYRVGEHRSPFKGFAIEFAQHREYTAGDDIRHLDWKVLGRSDRYYIKQYEQDTNYVANIVLDGSGSMNYGSGKLTKLHFAKVLAACLSYLVLIQRDAVALGIFDTDTKEYLPRTANLGKIHHIRSRLAAFEASDKTQLGPTVEQMSHKAKNRGIFILISDLMDDDDGFFAALQRLNLSGHEVIVFHVLDPYEITFPFKGTWRLLGLEDDTRLQTTPADIRKSYLEKFGEHCKKMRSTCEKFNTHYVLADTGKSLAEVISGYLAFRKMVGRK